MSVHFPLDFEWQGETNRLTNPNLKKEVPMILNQAKRFPHAAVLGLLFKPKAMPITPHQVDVFMTWLKNATSRPHLGKTILLEELTKLRTRIIYNMEHSKNLEELRFLLMRAVAFQHKRDLPFIEALDKRIQSIALHHSGNENVFRFPIVQLMSSVDIGNIPLAAWGDIHLDRGTILSQMFDVDTMPITPFECQEYIEAITSSDLAPTSKLIIKSVLMDRKKQIQHDFAALIVKGRCDSFEKFKQARLMEIHLNALDLDEVIIDILHQEHEKLRSFLSQCEADTDAYSSDDEKKAENEEDEEEEEDRSEDSGEETESDENVFPITKLKTAREIAEITTGALEALASRTRKLDPIAIIHGAMFIEETVPVTKMECEMYIVLLERKLNSKHLIDALTMQQKLVDTTAGNLRGIANDYKLLQTMKNRIDALDVAANTSKEYKIILRLLATQSLPKNSDDDEDDDDTFPIRKLKTAREIAEITTGALEALASRTKKLDPIAIIHGAMFIEETVPVTQTECEVYITLLERKLNSKHLIDALRMQQKLVDKTVNNFKGRANDYQLLQNMKTRIKALKGAKTNEYTIIDRLIATESLPQNSDDDDGDDDTFPIRKLKTAKEIGEITKGALEKLEEKVKDLDPKAIIHGAMFIEDTVPVTKAECKVYINLILDTSSSSRQVARALIRHEELIEKTTRNLRGTPADRILLSTMKRHIEALDVPDAINEYDRIRQRLEKESKQEDSNDEEYSDDPDFKHEDSDDEPEVKSTPPKKNPTKKPVIAEPPPKRQPTTKARAAANTNKRPIGSASEAVRRLDMSKPLVPVAQLRRFLDSYLRAAGDIQGRKKFPISKEFLQNVNMRLYEWVRDVTAFLQFTSQSPHVEDDESDDSDSNQLCDSLDIGPNAIAEAVQLANPEMSLLEGGDRVSFIRPNIRHIPEPTKKYLAQAMLYFANPLRRLTVAAYEVMAKALQERLVYLAKSLRNEVVRKNAIKFSVCPAMTTAGRVPHNKLTTEHFRARASTMYPHPDDSRYVVVSELDDLDPSDDEDKTIPDSDQDDTEEDEEELVDEERFF